MNTIYSTFLWGLITGFIGIIIGITASGFIRDRGRRFKGSVLGLLGGITLGVVSFDLLPEAFASGSIYLAITGIALGLFITVTIDGKLDFNGTFTNNEKSYNFLKASIFMAIGIGLHNLPSGVALGSLLYASPENGLHLAFALILHGVPEGLTLGIFLRESNASKLRLIVIALLTSLPMGIGSSLGGILKSPFTICISLSFASAMILYVTLRETLPAASDFWNGRLTTIGNVVGIILGLLMVSMFTH